jgi:hypothetical protein
VRHVLFRACSVALLAGLIAAPAASAHRSHHRAAAWYVQAGARAGGNGSARAPFNSLVAVQSASAPGDTIFVLPSSTPLGGGIALQTNQRLIGLGPDVTANRGRRTAAITNASATSHDGNGIVLADGTAVENVHVTDTYAAGIVGLDITRVSILDNLVTGFNESQTVGAVGFLGLQFGQAGIDVRADGTTTSHAEIRGNTVADATGNGTIFRTSDSAHLDITMRENSFHDLALASSLPTGNFGFVEAIFFDSVGSSTLDLNVDHMFVNNIGTGASNSDAIFSTLDGTSQQKVVLRHYIYRDTSGVGGSRASAGEYVTGEQTAGPGSKFSLTIADSNIQRAPQEGLQIDDFGTDEQVSVDVTHTVYDNLGHTTVPDPSEQPHTVADCIEIGPRNPANGSTYKISLTDDRFIDCGYNGIQLWNGPVTLTSTAAANVGSLSLDLRNDVFAHEGYAGLFLNDVGSYGRFALRAANTTFADNGTDAIDLQDATFGASGASTIDLGGGGLHSPGHNRIFGNADYDIAANSDFNVVAKHDWWGSPAGPNPAKISLQQSATFEGTPFLHRDPAH